MLSSTLAFGVATLVSDGFRSWPIARNLQLVGTFPATKSSKQERSLIFLLWWTVPVASLILFAFTTSPWRLWAALRRKQVDIERNPTDGTYLVDKKYPISDTQVSSPTSTVQ
jgi:hypothetical protein